MYLTHDYVCDLCGNRVNNVLHKIGEEVLCENCAAISSDGVTVEIVAPMRQLFPASNIGCWYHDPKEGNAKKDMEAAGVFDFNEECPY